LKSDSKLAICLCVLNATVFLILLTVISVDAQIEDNFKARKDSLYKSTRAKYIQDHTFLLSLRAFYQRDRNNIVYDNLSVHKSLDYWPNTPFTYGFGFNYRWLGLSISFPGTLTSSEIASKGKTTNVNIALFSYSRTFAFEAHYNYYKGYYIDNGGSLGVGQTKQGYPLRPDLQSENVDATFSYIFNHKRFSIRSSFIQTEQQLKSAATFILAPSFSWYSLGADSSLTTVPLHVPKSDKVVDQIHHLSIFNFTVSPGAGGTVVIKKKFFATLVAFIGPSIQYRQAQDQLGDTQSGYSVALRTYARFSIGYNSKWFFLVLSTYGDTYKSTITKNAQLEYILANARITMGTRLTVLDKIFKPRKSSNQIILEKD
jgi:hypothetical protein